MSSSAKPKNIAVFDLSTALFHPTPPGDPFLLAADIDGTLLGDAEGEAQLKALAAADPTSLHLAFITGRSRASVLELVNTGQLPCPDFICGHVGTDLYALNDPLNTIGQQYAAQVPTDWNLETIYQAGEGAGIHRQDFPEGQPPYQAGFFWDGQTASLEAFQQRMARLNHHRVLPSSGIFIDVLPASMGKGAAARFIQRHLALDPARVIVAGDTGNDRFLFETEFKGIVPVNALEELKAAANQPWHYHSLLPAARGVLDGLRHFGFIETG